MRASLVLNLRARAASLREQIFHLRRFRGPRGTIRMVRSFVSLRPSGSLKVTSVMIRRDGGQAQVRVDEMCDVGSKGCYQRSPRSTVLRSVVRHLHLSCGDACRPVFTRSSR
jgi:hypothetical protein